VLAVVTFLAALVAMATIVLTVHATHELLGWRQPWQQVLPGLLSLVPIVALVIALPRFHAWLERGAQARTRQRNDAEFELALRELRGDAQLSRWAPLAQRYRFVRRDMVLGWEQRYQQLLADPQRCRHAERLLRGEFPSDLQIDYADDPQLLLTCEHLRPIERDLRAARIPGAPLAGDAVYTAAGLELAHLRQHYDLPEFVSWRSIPPHPHDNGSETLVCTRCGSEIESGSGAMFPP
jgi:hypothetical protein